MQGRTPYQDDITKAADQGTDSVRPHDGQSLAQSPPKKKRKQRQYFSCAECRRLKLKCDRQVPCANCVRRSCGNLCPHGPRIGRQDAESNALKQRLEELESVLNEKGIPLPSQTATSESAAGMRLPDRARLRSNRSQSPPSQPPSTVSLPKVTRNDHPNIPSFNLPLEPPVSVPKTGPDIVFDTSYPPIETEGVHFDFSTNSPSITGHPVSVPSPAEEKSFGTLLIGRGGQSKWLGPTAASEWLRDQESQEFDPSPGPSRWPSPERREAVGFEPSSLFPFDGTAHPLRTKDLLSHLPPQPEARVLVDSYFRYFSWHYDVATKTCFEPVFERVYKALDNSNNMPHRVDLQELALVYILLAFGALHNLELPPNDPSAEEYLALSKSALAKGDFLTKNTLAGLQTLHVMAHFHLETERGRNGDSAWPLWGLAMRICQAMGLHRDGARWNLPLAVVEDRRRVFWESHAADIFQANCFSRPSTVNPDHIDTAFPFDYEMRDGQKGFSTLKFELCQISGRILDQAMKVLAPPYATILDLYSTICEFERNVPFHMRCRPALLALPSVYPDQSLAIQDSPEVSRRNLSLSFQQCFLAINISETILFLHRPYYAKALHSEVQDPTRSIFGPSYLAVVERCNAIIVIVSTLHSLHPNVSARHWSLWYHVFNCGVVMGTLVLRNPRNALAGFALSQIEMAIQLYTKVVQTGMVRLARNLQWLVKLRARAQKKVARLSTDSSGPVQSGYNSDEEDIELIGWRTRLIERAGKGAPKATTISSNSPSCPVPNTLSPNTMDNQALSLALQQYGSNPLNCLPADHLSSSSSNPIDSATDQLLHQFWDPMMIQDIPGVGSWKGDAPEWWDWDNAG